MPSYLTDVPFSDSVRLIEMAAMVNPVVQSQVLDPTTPPGADSGGVDVVGATRADLSVKVRETPFGRTCRATFDPDNVDLSGSETISWRIGSATGTVAGPWSTFADMLEAFRADVVADATANALVSVTVEDNDGDGVSETVKFVGKAVADYAFDTTVASTSSITARADAVSLDVKLYGRRIDNGANAVASREDLKIRRRGWALMRRANGSAAADWTLDIDGLDASGFPVGPMSHLFPYVENVAGVTGSPADGGAVVHVYSATIYQGAPQGVTAS